MAIIDIHTRNHACMHVHTHACTHKGGLHIYNELLNYREASLSTCFDCITLNCNVVIVLTVILVRRVDIASTDAKRADNWIKTVRLIDGFFFVSYQLLF